jgi:hypothetical protein
MSKLVLQLVLRFHRTKVADDIYGVLLHRTDQLAKPSDLCLQSAKAVGCTRHRSYHRGNRQLYGHRPDTSEWTQ